LLKDLGLSEEEKSQMNQNLGNIETQVRVLINQFILSYEFRYKVTLTEEQKLTIITDIVNQVNVKLNEDESVTYYEVFHQLRDDVVDLIEELLESSTEENVLNPTNPGNPRDAQPTDPVGGNDSDDDSIDA